MMDETPAARPTRFQPAHAVLDGGFYIERRADEELFEALMAGTPCHVLSARQTGKTSLRMRVAARLLDAGRRAVAVDLSTLGRQGFTQDQWLHSVARVLHPKSERREFDIGWEKASDVTSMQRFYRVMHYLALKDTAHPLIVVFDEVDALLDLPFRAAFLATLRALLNNRASAPELRLCSLCMLGTTLQEDLVRDAPNHPLVGASIELEDFSRRELDVFEADLRGLGCDPRSLLNQVHSWTSGHPAMTQHLCYELVIAGPQSSDCEARVSALVKQVYEDRRGVDPILTNVARYLAPSRGSADEKRARAAVARYGEVVTNGPQQRQTDEAERVLRIAGLARLSDSRVMARNRVFGRVFDDRWAFSLLGGVDFSLDFQRYLLGQKQPADLLRGRRLEAALQWLRSEGAPTREERAYIEESQRAAWRRRVWRYFNASLAAALAAAVVALFYINNARQREQSARRDAEEQRRGAQEAAERAAQSARVASAALDDRRFLETLQGAEHGGNARDALRSALGIALERVGRDETPDLVGSLIRLSARRNSLPIRAVSPAPLGQTDSGGLPQARDVHWSVDERWLVLALADGTVRRLNLHDWQWSPLAVSHEAEGWSTAVSSRGDVVASADLLGHIVLWDERSPAAPRVLQERGEIVTKLLLGPDARCLWATTVDGEVLRWDLGGGLPATRWRSHAGSIAKAAVSQDGSLLVTSGDDGWLRAWRGELAAWTWPTGGRRSAPVFALAGRVVLVAQEDGGVLGLQVDSGRVLWRVEAHRRPIVAMAVSLDARSFVTSDAGGEAQVRVVGSGALVASREVSREGMTWARFSHDGARVVLGGGDQRAIVWQVGADGAPEVLDGHDGVLLDALFLPGDHRLATIGSDGTIKIWDLQGEDAPLVLAGHTDALRSVAFSPDGARLLTASDDGRAIVWNAHSGVNLRSLNGHAGRVVRALFSPDGQLVATAGTDHSVRLWSSSEPGADRGLLGPAFSEAAWTVAFSPTSSQLAAASLDGTLRLWSVTNGLLVRSWGGRGPAVWELAFCSEGQWGAAVGQDGLLRVWRANSAEPPRVFRGSGRGIRTLSFLPGGDRLATAGDDGAIHLWDLRAEREIARHAVPMARVEDGPPQLIALSHAPVGGRSLLLAVAGRDGAVLWPPSSAGHVRLQREGEEVTDARGVPGSDLVATGAADGKVRLWRSDGTFVGGFDAGVGLITALAPSPDGRRLAVAGSHSEARVWPLVMEDIVSALCQGWTNVEPTSEIARRCAARVAAHRASAGER